MLLPDLIPWVDQSRGYLYGWTIQGNDLRLSTAVANIGTGALEIRGGAVNGNSQEVIQRVYNADGSYSDRAAGTYVYHSDHGHIHFEDFLEFRIRAVLSDGGVGEVVATGGKVSYCLIDIERNFTSGAATQHYMNCGQVQGISVGWADVYHRGLPGQSIDISNLPDGTYWLEEEIDSTNRLLEADETNNTARILITIDRDGSGEPIAPDTFEPSNDFATAAILAPPEDHTYNNLSIHQSGNADYYRVTASATGTLTFSLTFSNALGDVDMRIYDANQALLGSSTSVVDGESVSVNATAGQYFFVYVYGFQGATNPNYSLIVDQPEHQHDDADVFENNDSFATAAQLQAIDQAHSNLSIDAAGDDDYYTFTATHSGTFTLSLAFLNSIGDVDVQLFSAGQTELFKSSSVGDGEFISYQVTAGQTYFIRVYGFQGAINANYSMTIDMPAGTLTNTPPVITSDGGAATATRSIAENTTAVTTIVATDVNAGQTLTYAIVGGADAALFGLDPVTHALRFLTAPDFELPTDANGDNRYDVVVQVSDGNGGTDSQAITVSVTNVNDTGDVFENNDTAATATLLQAIDQSHTNLSIDAAFDDDYYTFTAAYSGTFTLSLAFLNVIGDVDVQLLNTAQTQLFKSSSVTDSEFISYEVTAGQTYFIRVYGYQGAINNNYSMTIDMPANTPPRITSDGGAATATRSVAENTTAVTTIVATDVNAGQALTYAIVGGADAAKFVLDAASHQLRFVTAPNFELPTDVGGDNRYEVVVEVADGNGGTVRQSLSISVTNVVGVTVTSNAATTTGTVEADRLTGGTGANTLIGLAGNDTLVGNGGNDQLEGGAGDDSLSGGSGNDRLIGAAGADVIDSGSGLDVIVFGPGAGNDRIVGFDANPIGGQDFIELAGFGITTATFATRVSIAAVGSDTRVMIDSDPALTLLLAGIANASTITVDDFRFL